jgi:hypothetical protein
MVTNFQSGIIAPMAGSDRFSNPFATHYFVDADDGGGGDGKSPEAAFTTIAEAVAAAGYQDVIYIRPKTYKLGTGFNRYIEDVSVTLGGSGGSGVVATNANMSLIGVSQRQHPSDFLGVRWKYATATPLTVDAPCLHVENIGFFTEAATYAINLRCNGATRTQEGTTGFSIYNCAIKGDGALYANGGNEIQIIKCRFQAKYDGTVGGINLVGSSNAVARPIIKDCDFVGGNANNMSDAPIRGASPWYTAVLANLWFDQDTDTGLFVSVSGTACTGVIGPCFCGSGDISTTSFDTAGMEVVGAFDDDGIQAGADA